MTTTSPARAEHVETGVHLNNRPDVSGNSPHSPQSMRIRRNIDAVKVGFASTGESQVTLEGPLRGAPRGARADLCVPQNLTAGAELKHHEPVPAAPSALTDPASEV